MPGGIRMIRRESRPTISTTTAATMTMALTASNRGRNRPDAPRPIATRIQTGLIGGWRWMRTTTGTRPCSSRCSMASAASSGPATASVIWTNAGPVGFVAPGVLRGVVRHEAALLSAVGPGAAAACGVRRTAVIGGACAGW